jgi:hypothetical protein
LAGVVYVAAVPVRKTCRVGTERVEAPPDPATVVVALIKPVTARPVDAMSKTFVPFIANPSLFAPIRYRPVPVSVDRYIPGAATVPAAKFDATAALMP